jgi:hypothetical protein
LSFFDAAATVILGKQSASAPKAREPRAQKEAVAALLRMSTSIRIQDYLVVATLDRVARLRTKNAAYVVNPAGIPHKELITAS